MQRVDELLEGFLSLWRSLQLQEHVLHGKVVVDFAAVIFRPRFGTSVALEGYTVVLIDIL